MGNRKIIWKDEAVDFVERYLQWYRRDRSKSAANKFFDSVKVNIERLRCWPDIGRLEPEYTMRGYESYRILYGYNEDEIVIIALWDMRAIK